MGGYVQIRRIIGTLFKLILKVWAYSGLVLVFCFLLYYFYGGLFAILLLITSIAGVLYHVQDNFLFYPEHPSHSRVYVPVPSTVGLGYESVEARASDGTRLHFYFIPAGAPRAPTLLYLHGNAGNMGHRLPNCRGLHDRLRCNVLLAEYRGYGLSGGRPSEAGLYRDARAALDYLHARRDVDAARIVVFGRSLGGAVAIDLASRPQHRRRVMGVIVENTFTSIPDMVRALLGWRVFDYLPRFCYRNKFQSIDKVHNLAVPTLFVSGMADNLVPPRMMRELYLGCDKRLGHYLPLLGGTHNETWTLPGYYSALSNFLATCCKMAEAEKSETIVDIKEGVETDWETV